MTSPIGRAQPPRQGLTWESFGVSALWRLVGLLALLVVVLGVITGSWDVVLVTARLALLVLFVIATWLYVHWFLRQRAELSRRDDVVRDQSKNYRPH